MKNINQLTINEIVSNDYRTALVLQAFGIDVCCTGNQTILEACTTKKADPGQLIEKLLESMTSTSEENFDFKSWPLSILTDYIETKHHSLIRDRIPIIMKFLQRVVKVHSAHEPNLKKIKALFEDSMEDLQRHLKQEELIIFPFIKKISSDPVRKDLLFSPSYRKITELIFQLMAEHEVEGLCLEEIRKLSDDYTPPAYACNTYKVAFAMLQEFDISLQKHIHLESNILFPEVIAQEFKSPLN